MNKEQALLALSYKNLSTQQKEQILAQMGLIASENTIQSELLQTTLAQKGVSAEKSKAILIELGLMNQQTGELLTQKACTKADLEAILAQKGITGAQAEGIISALGLSGANAGLTASFGLLGKAIWGVTKALLSNPITWIVAGFAGLVAITDAVTTSTEEYKEQLDDLKSEYNEITSEIQSVNSELQTTIDRMKELEGKDSLTFTEKEEYDNLVKTNNELQRKIDLLELEEKQKNKEKNKTFVDTMVSDTENPFEHEVNPNGKTEGQYQISDNYLTSETGYIEAQFEIRDQLLEDLANAETEKEKERIQKRIDEIEKYLNDKNDEWKNVSDGISYIENPTTEDDKAVNEWLDYIADFQDRMAIAMSKDDASSNAQYKTNTFNRVVDNWQFDETVQGLQDLGKEGKVTAEMLNDPKYDEFINKLVFLGVIDSADNLEDVALAFNSVADSAKNAADSTSQYDDETRISSQSISQTIDQLNTQLKPAFDSLKDAYLDIFTLDDNGNEVFNLENVDLSMLDDIKSTIDELNENEELGISIDYSSFEDLSKTLMDNESTAEEVRESINLFATDIVNALNPALNQTTGENYKFVQSLLESLNIINSEAVMISTLGYSYEEYILAKEECAEAGFDLANATQDEIDAFMYEEDGAIKCGEALALLELKKQLVNGTLLDTNSDIENVLTLAKAAGITIESLDKLAIAKSKFDEAIKTGDGRLIGSAAIELQHAKDEVENAILDFEPVEVDFTPKQTDKKSSSSSKDTSKEFDWIEPKLKNIENRMSQLRKVSDSAYSTFAEKNQALADQIHLVNEEIQLQQQAYEGYIAKAESVGLSDDYKKLVQEGAINIEKISDKELQEAISNYQTWYEKAKETQDKITDLHEQSKDLRVEAADNGANELKELLDHQAITEREYIDRMNDLWEFYYANQVELAEVAKDKKLELLEEEKSYLQSVGSAAIALLDDQIDDLEDQKDSAVQGYKDQIEVLENLKKPLEDQLEMMEKAKEKEEKILALQKAQYELKRAQNQRDQLKFVDGQMVYTADDKAVRDAQKDVDDAEFELSKFKIQEQIDAYDRQIEKLNELIDDTEKYYDKQIKGLNEYKEEWQKAIDMEELAVNMQNFIDKFGEGSIGKLLSGDMSLITTWKQSYLDTLKEIDMTSNGTIGDITNKFKELSGLDFSPSVTGISEASDKMSALADSANNAASAIGGATGGANAQQGENAQGGSNAGGTNLVGAIGEVKTATDTALGSNGGESKDGESSEGGGEGAIGKFSQLKTAVDAVTTAIGTGEEEEGSGEEGAINLIGALQTQYEIASEILPEEIAFFNELLASITACVDGLNAMASSISSVSGVSVTPHAEGTVGKAFASGTGNYKGLPHAEKNALRSEYGQPELTVYPDGTTELTTEPTMSDLPKDTVIFNEEQTKRIMNNEGTVIGNAHADGNAVLQKATTPSYLRPIQEGDKGYELIKAARVYQDMLKTNIMLPVNSIDKNVEMMTRNISAVNTSNVNKPTVNVGGITVNCPNVNSKEIAMKVSTELEKAVFGMSNLAYQKANITR